MFIARSRARIRAARMVFLLAGAVPVAAFVAWAAYLHSDSHRTAVERQWQDATGLPLSIGRVEHPRPGVVRVHEMTIPAGPGRPACALPLIEIESSADEDRLRIDGFTCDPAVASVLTGLARAWITDDVRFRRTCIVEVADFRWTAATAPPRAASPPEPVALRVECVTRDGSRAMRIVRRGSSVDELRIVRQSAPGAGAADSRLAIDATSAEPIPLTVLAVASGVPPDIATARAADAWVSGSLAAVRDDGGWNGTAEGRVTDIDLAATTAAVGGQADGTASITISRLTWENSRLVDGLIECATGPGWIDGRLFDRIVLATGAQPGPAAGPLQRDVQRPFDAAACIATVGENGVQFLPASRLPAALALHNNAVLLAPATAPVPGDRLAWMLTAPGTGFGPAAGPGAWLMSVLPAPPPPGTGTRRQF
jgi:hypothetical protein